MSFIYEPQAPWIAESNLKKFIEKLKLKSYEDLLLRSQENPEWFWSEVIRDIPLRWTKPYSKLLSKNLPWPEWAVGGELSIVENCIDRNLKERSRAPALIFEADEPEKSQTWTFEDLARESSWIAAKLQNDGAKPGDRAALLMPMSLEMVASFFGILRAGLTVVPIFSGYGAEAISARLKDGDVKFVFHQAVTTRKGKVVHVLDTLREALKDCPNVRHVYSLKREEFIKGHRPQSILPPLSRPSESEAMLLYTSGTTGKPKACVHTPFGVLATTAKELRYAFDVKPGDRFFWYTDIGWMMGPWELIGALQLGATVVLFEGVPDYPTSDRLWDIVRTHQVTHLGISPTAIRVLKKSETGSLDQQPLSSLRLLGSTGEPWDEESWNWYFEKVGGKRCPIMNISGGTEIMGCLLMPNPFSKLKPTTLAGPALGVRAEVWNEDGQKMTEGLGHLVCLTPLPSMTKGFLNNREKYLETYFEKFGESVWYHGDWALIDSDGLWFLKGRSDDTIKIAGKRVGPNEFESALMEDSRVQESAAVGIPHEVKGETVYCYVVLKNPSMADEAVRADLLTRVSKKMGKALSPERIYFVSTLPKTRSGKILRGLIRKIVLKETFDSSAVENPQSIDAVQKAS